MDELLKITDNVSLALQALDKENGDDKSLGKGQDETLTCKWSSCGMVQKKESWEY